MKKSKNTRLFILLISFLLFLSIFLVKIYRDNQKAYSHLSEELKNLNEDLSSLTLLYESNSNEISIAFEDINRKFDVNESNNRIKNEYLLRELNRLKGVLVENRDSVDSINVTTEQMKLILSNGFNQIGVDEINKEVLLEMVFNDGISLFKEKNFIESLKIFKEAQSIYPYDREIKYYYLASLYYSNRQSKSNLPFLKEQLALLTHDQDYAEKALLILVDIYLDEDDLEKSAQIYSALYKQNETRTEYLKSLALLRYELGNYQLAVDDFRSFISLNPKDYEAMYYLALSLSQLYIFDEALEKFYLVRNSSEPFSKLEEKILDIEQKLELNR